MGIVGKIAGVIHLIKLKLWINIYRYRQEMCRKMFITALLLVEKNFQQPKFLFIEEGINKMWNCVRHRLLYSG
jgi:hypothetical protein